MVSHKRLVELLTYLPEEGVFVRNSCVRGRAAGSRIGAVNSEGYELIYVDGARYAAHRLAFFYMTGEFPVQMVDHINGVKTDNRFCNLRLASNAQNQANAKYRSSSASGVVGVRSKKKSGKWVASMKFDGKTRHIGSFETINEAKSAYVAEKKKVFGSYFRDEQS